MLKEHLVIDQAIILMLLISYVYVHIYVSAAARTLSNPLKPSEQQKDMQLTYTPHNPWSLAHIDIPIKCAYRYHDSSSEVPGFNRGKAVRSEIETVKEDARRRKLEKARA